jgi:hypothetical protein
VFTTFHVDKILNLYRATNYTAPANTYAGLIQAVTDAEAGTVTESSFSGYARQAITFAAPAAGLGGRFVQNSSAVTFPAKGDAGSVSIIAVGYWDALTVGNLMEINFLHPSILPFVALVDGTGVTNDTLAASNHGMSNDQKVRVEVFPGGASIPTGLSENTEYFVVGTANDTFQLSTTQGGGAVNLTGEGWVVVHPYTPVTINQNDQAQFAINALKSYLD